jgi:hypothetical protein
MQRAFFIKGTISMQFREVITVRSESDAKPINTICAEDSEVLNVKSYSSLLTINYLLKTVRLLATQR